jgi:ferredoxin-NADP reductase
VRLTAGDGYTAQRSYSIASAPGDPRLELTVVRIDDGEVSPYLAGTAEVGDQLELRGPIGGWFVWDDDDDTSPVLLVGGGSGVVPLMAMMRHHADRESRTAMHLLYSARSIDDVIYRDELEGLGMSPHRAVTVTLTRDVSSGWTGHRGRVDAALLEEVGWPSSAAPRHFVCGPNAFVEAVANDLVTLTERFGPTGG